MARSLCIVGGGPVGLTAALAFSRQHWRVQLLEQRDYPSAQAQGESLDARSIALSASSVSILTSLGLWPALQPHAAAIRHIHISSAGHFGVTRLQLQDLPFDAMGYVIEYDALLQVLLQAAQQDPNIELILPAELQSVEQNTERVELVYRQADQPTTLTADWLMVADGAQSTLRQRLGIEAQVMDYQQCAIIANLQLEQADGDIAFERFTRHGPMALLPLPGQRYAMVWTNPPARCDHLLALSDADFLQAVYQQFGYRLGYFSALGKRTRFALKRTRAKQLVAGRAALVGNAANTLHPVAGQGFNLALRDVGVLYDLMAPDAENAEDIPQRLQQYQASRLPDQNRVVQAGDGLVQLFSNNWPLLNHARAAALAALDLCPPLKQEVSWQGMGYGSGCSSLMRGQLE